MNKYEMPYWNKQQVVVGIDEAGRGPMAGPLLVCGVVLPANFTHSLINDSKKLSEKQRLLCYEDIKKAANKIVVCIVSPVTIDEINIYAATKQSMESIVNCCALPALIDAMPVHSHYPTTSIIKGDQQSISIAAASIVAKVMRDKIMMTLDGVYPDYGFRNHKGYPTKAHKSAMEKHGLTPIHRKSFTFKQ